MKYAKKLIIISLLVTRMFYMTAEGVRSMIKLTLQNGNKVIVNIDNIDYIEELKSGECIITFKMLSIDKYNKYIVKKIVVQESIAKIGFTLFMSGGARNLNE